ncbi:hypothetical protein MTO96_027043 [Rhipicephalus appendiculatus]
MPRRRKKILLLNALGAEGLDAYYMAADERSEVDANQGTGAGAASDAYQQALAVLDAYFTPPEDVVCVRAQFRRRVQHSEERAVQYVMELRRLADSCSFGTAATTMVRDPLLHGLQDAHLARTFIRMGDAFTVQKALEHAKQEERVERTTQQLATQVNAVTQRKHGCLGVRPRQPAVVPACCVASLPACRVASAYDGSVPGHVLMQQLRPPDCPASPRRPAADGPVVQLL